MTDQMQSRRIKLIRSHAYRSQIMRDYGLSHAAVLLLSQIASGRRDRYDRARVGQRALAHGLVRSVSTVQRHTRQLRKANLIQSTAPRREPDESGQWRTIGVAAYRVVLPMPAMESGRAGPMRPSKNRAITNAGSCLTDNDGRRMRRVPPQEIGSAPPDIPPDAPPAAESRAAMRAMFAARKAARR